MTYSEDLRKLVTFHVDLIEHSGKLATRELVADRVRQAIARPTDETAWYWLEIESIALDVVIDDILRHRRVRGV